MWHAGCFSASGIECCESSGKWILFRTRRSASQGHSVSAATLCSVSLTAQHRMKERRSHEAHFLLAGFVPSERCACTGMPVSQPRNAGCAYSSSYFPQDCYVLPIFFLFCCRSVAKLCPPLLWPQDCSPPGSSVHGVLRVRTLEWDAVSFSGDLPDPGTEPTSPAPAGAFSTTEPPGKFFWILQIHKCYQITVTNIFSLPLKMIKPSLLAGNK